MCEVSRPTPSDRICDPAAGTGGFLCSAYEYVLARFGAGLDRDLQEELVYGMELSPKVGRMCAMNLYLHGIGGEQQVAIQTGHDSRASCKSGGRRGAPRVPRGDGGAMSTRSCSSGTS
jgi:type I restriction enzyme M protein